MSRKLVLAMVLILFIGMLGATVKVHRVKASGTIYIRADGSVVPSAANITSVDNVTYTFIDNIDDSIVVERDSIVVDGAGHTVQGTGIGTGINLSGRSNVTIKNMEIKAFEYGIWLMNSSKNTISENNITNNIFSIHVCDYSHHNSISENTMTNNSHGVALVCSSNNIVSGNMMNGNQYNFEVWGFELNHFMHSIDVSNLVNGKPAYYHVNHKGLVINPTTHPKVGYLALINCDNVTVEDLTLTNNCDGLLLAYSSNSRIKNNNIINNYHGVVLYSSSYISVSENNITNNRCGVRLLESSNNNFSGNTIANNDDEGFKIFDSSNNILSGNSITNNHDGIWLFDFLDNSISGNNITNNVRGICLRHYSNDN